MNPIRPPVDPVRTSDREFVIRQEMEKFYLNTSSYNQSFQQQARVDSLFEAGDTTICGSLYSSPNSIPNRILSFNRIRRIVNIISGQQRRNRKSMICTPVENSDELTADQFTKIFMWINKQENVLDTISSAFRDAIITGLAMLQVWVDYRQDPLSGNIKVDHCPYANFYLDPFFKKPDLSDCNVIWKRSYLTKDECFSIAPAYKEEIESVSLNNNLRDGKFIFTPEYNYLSQSNLLTYDEYYYRSSRSQKLITDVITGESMEWTGNDEALSEFLQLHPQLRVDDHTIPTINTAILVNGRLIYDDQNPLGLDRFPFVPVWGYFSPGVMDYGQRIQGIVRSLRDPQYLYNRRKTLELQAAETKVNTGWIYKENALVDPKAVFLAGSGRGIALKADATLADIQRIDPTPDPDTRLSEILGKEIAEIAGTPEELMGMADDAKAGIQEMLRQRAGLVGLQTLFDSVDSAQKQLGIIELELAQRNFTPGKVQRIIEEQPSPQFYSKVFGTFDVVIEDGFNTSTQKQMEFMQLIQLRELNIPIPDDVMIEAATVQNKKQLIEKIQQQQQQQQQQAQQVQQAQTAEVIARTDLANARAQADLGLRMERESRVFSNIGLMEERKHASEKDEQAAMLDTIKALKEIDGMDLEHIGRLLEMMKSLKESENTDVKEEAIGSAIIKDSKSKSTVENQRQNQPQMNEKQGQPQTMGVQQ